MSFWTWYFFTRLRIIWSTLVLPLFPSCTEALGRLEHPILSFLSLSPRDVEQQHIRNLFLLERPESGTQYSLAEWTANATLTSFKYLLYDYYSRALRTNYNLDNHRTLKTICLKCNSKRFLDVPILRCM